MSAPQAPLASSIATPPAAAVRSRWERPTPGVLWRQLLDAPAQPRARLRRWALWSWWAGHTTWRARLGACRALAELPFAALREARDAVAERGPAVRMQHGVSPQRQLLELCRLRATHGIRASTYYRFQLFLPHRRRVAGQFVQVHEAEDLLRVLMRRVPGEQRRVFLDKPYFDAWCASRGIPSVPTVAEFAGGRMIASADGVPPLPHVDLFSKPTNWQSGRGVHRWRYRGDGQWAGSDGDLRTEDRVLEDLANMSTELGRPILLQRLLRNRADLAALTPGGLCTVRVVTLRRPTGTVTPLLAVYRMPVGDTPADNFDLGGIAAPVDLATGRLGPAVRKRADLLVEAIARHPDTGAEIAGHQLPTWPETLRLTVSAHEALEGTIPFVGWDVALLDEGPVLLEANNVPCTILSQLPSGVPLGATEYPACLAEYLRQSFAR